MKRYNEVYDAEEGTLYHLIGDRSDGNRVEFLLCTIDEPGLLRADKTWIRGLVVCTGYSGVYDEKRNRFDLTWVSYDEIPLRDFHSGVPLENPVWEAWRAEFDDYIEHRPTRKSNLTFAVDCVLYGFQLFKFAAKRYMRYISKNAGRA
jgi:hypothetical protein